MEFFIGLPCNKDMITCVNKANIAFIREDGICKIFWPKILPVLYPLIPSISMMLLEVWLLSSKPSVVAMMI
jgi:hypothetical protein